MIELETNSAAVEVSPVVELGLAQRRLAELVGRFLVVAAKVLVVFVAFAFEAVEMIAERFVAFVGQIWVSRLVVACLRRRCTFAGSLYRPLERIIRLKRVWSVYRVSVYE